MAESIPPGARDAPQAVLVGRVHDALARLPGRDVRQVRMFGGLAFMLDDAMLVSVGKGADLLVRIDPARHDDLVALPGARPAMMGADRPMGPGWLTVSADALATGAGLGFWLDTAREYHATHAGKPARQDAQRR